MKEFKLRQEMLGRTRQYAAETGDTPGILADAVAIHIHQHGAEVVGLPHDGGERRPQQRRGRLIGNGDQPRPVDFQRDRIKALIHRPSPILKREG